MRVITTDYIPLYRASYGTRVTTPGWATRMGLAGNCQWKLYSLLQAFAHRKFIMISTELDLFRKFLYFGQASISTYGNRLSKYKVDLSIYRVGAKKTEALIHYCMDGNR